MSGAAVVRQRSVPVPKRGAGYALQRPMPMRHGHIVQQRLRGERARPVHAQLRRESVRRERVRWVLRALSWQPGVQQRAVRVFATAVILAVGGSWAALRRGLVPKLPGESRLRQRDLHDTAAGAVRSQLHARALTLRSQWMWWKLRYLPAAVCLQ